MENYLSEQQVTTILQGAPKGSDPSKIVDALVAKGYKLQGFNDIPEPPKRNVAEKIADFTGGKELAQGLGQTIANRKTIPEQEKFLNDTIKKQSDLLKKKKEAQQLGGDTSAIDKAIEFNKQNMLRIGNGMEDLFNPNKLTGKQIAGDALQLATTVVGAGKIPSTTKAITSAPTVAGGILQGAKTGALTGGVFGASTGVSQGLQDDLTGSEIVKKGVSGAIGGAVTGGILGGVTGGISGGIKSTKIAKENKYLDAITPNTKDLTPTEYEDLLSRGKITPKTSTSPAQYVLSEEEKQIAQKYKSLFTNDPVKNTTNIIDEISKKDAEVGKFLKENNGIFNTGELKNNLSKKLEGIDDLLVPSDKLAKAKSDVVDNFVKSLKKNDMESLWKARKEFDRQIEKAFTGSPTLQNNIKKEFRNAVQDFIAERTPEGVYKASMKDMTQLFNLKDIVTTKATKEKGLSAIQVWIKRNPTKAKAIGWTAGTGVAGTLLGSALKD